MKKYWFYTQNNQSKADRVITWYLHRGRYFTLNVAHRLIYKMFTTKCQILCSLKVIHTFNIMLYEFPRVWNLISQDTLWHLTALKSLLQVESGKNVYKYTFFSFSQICWYILSTLYTFLIMEKDQGFNYIKLTNHSWSQLIVYVYQG